MSDQFHSVHIIVLQNDQVLLVKHGERASHVTGVLGLPGGRSKDDESEKETAVRELREETGVVVEIKNLYEFPNNIFSAYIKRKIGPSGVFTMKVFMTNKFRGTLKRSGETEPLWIKTNELKQRALLPNVEEAIMQARRYYDSINKTLKVRPDLA